MSTCTVRSSFPFSQVVADLIRDRWDHGGNFLNLADAMLDLVALHIAQAAKLDRRLADAIESHLDHDPAECDADENLECSVEDVEAWRARQHARISVSLAVKTAGGVTGSFTKEEAEGMIGAMLRRPGEVMEYLEARRAGCSAANALALVLNKRKETDARNAHQWNGGKL